MLSFNVLKQWVLTGSFSIADQALFAGSNFVLNILLARWMEPAEYGAFAVAFSVFIFLSGFQNAIILEPMSVIGPVQYAEDLRGYLRIVFILNTIIGIIILFVLLGVSLFLSVFESSSVSPFLGLALSSPFTLLFWLFRRVWYLKTKPQTSVAINIFYSVTLFFSLYVLHSINSLTPFSGFVVLGMACTASSAVSLLFYNIHFKTYSFSTTNPHTKDVFLKHWHYGKWVVGSAFVFWLSGSIYVPLIGIFAGLENAGIMRALQNLILPVNNILTALTLLLLPWLSAKKRTSETKSMRKAANIISGLMILIAIIYMIFPMVAGEWLVNILYGQSKYNNYLWMIPYLGIIVLLNAAGQGFSLSLRSAEYPNALFWSQLGSAIITLTIGILLVWKYNLLGAMWGNIISAIVALSIVVYSWKLLFKEKCT
jgi:O-antigen/teichoic acid export membrane protein